MTATVSTWLARPTRPATARAALTRGALAGAAAWVLVTPVTVSIAVTVGERDLGLDALLYLAWGGVADLLALWAAAWWLRCPWPPVAAFVVLVASHVAFLTLVPLPLGTDLTLPVRWVEYWLPAHVVLLAVTTVGTQAAARGLVVLGALVRRRLRRTG